MQIGCTEMHPIVLGVIIIELILLGAQGVCFLERPEHRNRIWQVLFLALLLMLNIINGFFPNPLLDVPLYLQYIFRNGIVFITISYFPFKFFKALQIVNNKFQERREISFLLVFPYPIIFFITYAAFNDFQIAHRYTIFIPCLNNIFMMSQLRKSIWNIYRRNIEKNGSLDEIYAFIMLITWLFAYFAIHQNWGKTIEIIFINLGPATFNILLLYNNIKIVRFEQEHLQQLNLYMPQKEVIILNCRIHMLSERETEIAMLLCHRLKRQQIADKLFISVRTVDKHVERIFLKTGVSCRENLLNRLNKYS